MTFQDLGLHPKVLQAIEELGFSQPTPIQLKGIPKVLRDFDIRASAQTGTGKTGTFLLPALTKLMTPSGKPGKGPRILVLVPTRELAMQVSNEAAKFSKYLHKMKTVCIYGGTPYPLQNKQLSRPYEILVATPGRLIDQLNKGRINLSRIEMLILDEADRMLDMGFIDPVKQIAALTPKDRQTLLFSATMKGSVMALSQEILNNPMDISVAPEKADHTNIEQRLHSVGHKKHKSQLLDFILKDPTLNQAIVFTSTKSFADQLTERLLEQGHAAAALHGDMHQRKRTKTLSQLREGKIRILVATDVAARGIDILTISHVINFDLPSTAEDYVHRIGRTGRAGANGVAFSFATPSEMRLIKEIEKYTGQKMMSQNPPEGMEIKIEKKSERKSRGGPKKWAPRKGGTPRGKDKFKRMKRRSNTKIP